MFWRCPKAQLLWTQLHERWCALGLWETEPPELNDNFITSIFSLRLPAVPRRAWNLPSLRKLASSNHRARAEVYPTLLLAWQQQVLTTLKVILQWRQGLHEEETAWTPRQACVIHAAALQSALKQLQHGMETAERPAHCGPTMLRDLLAEYSSPLHSEPDEDAELHTGRYVLFFDGGSRGNPGPGGAGAVIVSTDVAGTTARVVWSASMSYKNKTTTNNQAEYRGVVAGLAAAETHAWSPIEVVGDSMLILRQLANYRSPRNARLFPLYAAARRSADRLGVTKWLHHLRAFNKMADHMANVAMDSQTSIQMCHPTTRLEHSNLQRLLTGDFQHWQVEASERLVSTW